jgi:hypothetical protein
MAAHGTVPASQASGSSLVRYRMVVSSTSTSPEITVRSKMIVASMRSGE